MCAFMHPYVDATCHGFQTSVQDRAELHAPAVLSLVLSSGLGTMAPILGTEPLPSNSKPVAVTHRHATCHFLTVACPNEVSTDM